VKRFKILKLSTDTTKKLMALWNKPFDPRKSKKPESPSDRGVSFAESKNSLKMLVEQLLRVLIYNCDHSISILVLAQTMKHLYLEIFI